MKQFIFETQFMTPDKILSAFSTEDQLIFLDSSDHEDGSPRSEYSFFCIDPIETIVSRHGRTTVHGRAIDEIIDGNAFDILRDRLQYWSGRMTTTPQAIQLPFAGGAAGYFGYALAGQADRLRWPLSSHPDIPDMQIGIYDTVIALKLSEKRAFLCVAATDGDEAEQKKIILQNKMDRKIRETASIDASPIWHANRERSKFIEDVEHVIDYIRAGDIFQTNLSHSFSCVRDGNFDPVSFYRRSRRVNPAPFSAFLRFGTKTVVSASPERFIRIKNRIVETRPIKGTISIEQPVQALSNSVKDRAENTMIVDVLRNDLSKFCVAESIAVPEFCAVETYRGLRHLVSSVTGILNDDADAVSALRCCFPGGSITGAPKIRAMEIIEELESSPRGVYCGSIGYVGFDGDMDTNIAIRTVTITKDQIFFNVGGGITILSDAEKEYEETLLKAKKIFESFGDQHTASTGQS